MDSIWLDLLGAEIGRAGGRFPGRYLTMGAGEPLILLHGQGGHLENFCRNVAAYARHFQVFALDAAWHGLGPQPPFDTALIPVMVEQVLSFMDWRGLPAAHIEGQSMGGWTAMRLAVDHPQRVRRLVLTTPQGYVVTSPSGEAFAAVPGTEVRDAQLACLNHPTAENIRRRVSGLFADPDRVPDEVVVIRQKIYQNPTANRSLRRVVSNYMGGAQSAPRAHLVREDQLARIKAPTLVYWSDQNPGPQHAGERLAAAIAGAQYYCAADTGHWAQFEHADEHNRRVTAFLANTA